jgi:hypothetical protein
MTAALSGSFVSEAQLVSSLFQVHFFIVRNLNNPPSRESTTFGLQITRDTQSMADEAVITTAGNAQTAEPS